MKTTQTCLCKGTTVAAFFIAAAVLVCYFKPYTTSPRALSNLRESKPYYQYVHQPKQELVKLLQVIDQFKNTKFKVIYDGHEYSINTAMNKAKQFMNTHYKDQKAESMVEAHLYRSQSKGEIIYLKYPDGRLRPLRDVMIEKLHSL